MTKTGIRKEMETRKAKFIEALTKSMGIVTIAVKETGYPRSTFYKWCNDDKAFKEKVDEVTETQVDYVESELLKRIKEGDTTAIIFYLKTKGRNRGYGEVEKTRDTSIKVNVVEQ